LRRYLLTILLLLALLVLGGLAVASLTAGPSLERGGYVPVLSTDPQTAQLEATIFVGALLAVIVLTLVLGVFLAISFYRFTLVLAANASTATAGERSGTSKPSSSNQGLGIPLSNPRSLAVFWVVLALLVIVLQVLRYWGDNHPFGYLPGLDGLMTMQVLQLPGNHIAGLPAFVSGPGDWVSGGQLLVLVLLGSIVAVGVVGLGLARGFDRLGYTVQNADKLPKTFVDKMIPQMEQRIESLRQPRPKRLPGNPIDGFLIGLNALLALVIIGIVVFYVIPSYSGVAAVDNSVKATQLAAAAPPTQPATTNTGGPSAADQLAQQLAALPKGDAARGQSLVSTNGCTACHISAPVGPGWMATADNATPKGEGVGTRAQHRFKDAGYTGAATSADGYLLESIIHPNAYVVTGFTSGVMPQTFAQTLQPQDLADIIAYLDTLK
jgi:cytochrome c2